VVLSARELDLDQLPASSWQNRHLVFTHGYGVAASPSNGVTVDGRPTFVVKDIPPVSEDIEFNQPGLYFGEKLSGYAFVNTKVAEYDFPREPEDATTTYNGDGGVRVNNFVRRAALALRFADLKVLISDQITSDSKALYLRDIRERVEKAAPFLHFDADPYPVLLGGRVLWVIDAYTATDRFPYAQEYTSDPARLPGSGLRGRFNYVRNSVKATVDAYDGSVRFYVVDDAERDPMIESYRKAFPSLFLDRSAMPDGLEEHLRYPEDLFRVQTDRYAEYQVTDPQTFFRGSREWDVAQDPVSGRLSISGTAQQPQPTVPGPGPARTVAASSAERRMDPYYLLMRLPGQEEPSFLILQPFVPTARGDREPKNLISFMVAKSDPGEYGKLEAYTMPLDEVVLGPAQVDSFTQTTPEISRTLTPLNQSGSQVFQGSLLLIPVEESILYVRPLYLQAEGNTPLPELEFLIVAYGGEAVLGRTLDEALAQLFPGLEGTAPPGDGTTPPPAPPPPPPGGGDPTVASLLA
ncbi:MAG: UPF0182 family protein, partial [Candidatus Methylomirabilales bacterium]